MAKGISVVLFVVIFAWFLTKCTGSSEPPSPAEVQRKLERDRLSAAEYFAEQVVEKQLKAPSTADFGRQKSSYSARTQAVTVVGYVDAQNGFGAMIRNDYIVVVRSVCDSVWEWRCWDLHALTIGDQVIGFKSLPTATPPAKEQRKKLETTPKRTPTSAGSAPGDIDVTELQRLLEAKGFDPGPVDGKWGPKTAEALREFRKSTGSNLYGPPSVTDLLSLRK